MNPVLLTLVAYLVGATPTSYWVGKRVYGVDLRTVGSGNLGATNTYRTFGLGAAAPVMVIDVLKGWAPVALFPLLHDGSAGPWAVAYGAAAILGHVFSFWVGFRGGKGVATSTGVFLALAPWAVAVGLAIWLAAVLATRYVSLGSVLAAAALPASVALTPHRGGGEVIAFAAALALFVIWAHRANLGRLMRGEENRMGRPREGAS